jgi:hypothetical protein
MAENEQPFDRLFKAINELPSEWIERVFSKLAPVEAEKLSTSG